MAAGHKTGGRTRGTPNKATAHVKGFLEGVFTEAFENPEFRKLLIDRIVTLQIDGRLLTTLLQFYAGRPAQSVDVRHEGTVSLAQLIVGDVPTGDDDSEE